ncbi:MAG TPA: hypothetical protein VIZ86_16560 [Pseudomonas sp.]
MSLQAGWLKSMARLSGPTALRAARLTLRGIGPDGRGLLFRLDGSGPPDLFAAERLAALLFADLGRPVSVVIRHLPGGQSVRGYCDAGTSLNLQEVRHG